MAEEDLDQAQFEVFRVEFIKFLLRVGRGELNGRHFEVWELHWVQLDL